MRLGSFGVIWGFCVEERLPLRGAGVRLGRFGSCRKPPLRGGGVRLGRFGSCRKPPLRGGVLLPETTASDESSSWGVGLVRRGEEENCVWGRVTPSFICSVVLCDREGQRSL